MEHSIIEADPKRLGAIAVALTVTLLALYVFDLSPAVGASVLVALLLLLLGGFGWHFRDRGTPERR